MEVQCKITKADGAAMAENDEIGPINNILHSLFSNIEMELCGKNVSDPNNLYPYRAYVENSWNYSKEVAKMRLICEGFVKDTPGKRDDGKAKTGANDGLKTRAAQFAKSAIVKLVGRPHLDLFHVDKLIPPNCDIMLRFVPAKSAFVLIGADGN